MLNLLGCLGRPTSGTYILNGHDVSSLNDDAAVKFVCEIGLHLPSFNLIPQLTVRENIELPLLLGWDAATPPNMPTWRIKSG